MKRKRAFGRRKPKVPSAEKNLQKDAALGAQYDVLNDEAEQPEINTSCQPLGNLVSDQRTGRNIHSLHKGTETPRTGTSMRDRQEDLDIAEAVSGRIENCPNSLRQMIASVIKELSMETGGLANMSRSLGDNPISNEQTVQHRVVMDVEENASGLHQDPEYKKQELDAALAVIKKTMKLAAAEPFNRPVDPIALEIPDYFDVIKTPMDFGTICNNLENGLKYASSEDVYNDVQYIWYNCLTYNKKGNPILELMKQVKTFFMKYWVAAGLHTEKSPAIVDTTKTKQLKNTRKLKNPVIPPSTTQFVSHVQPALQPMPTIQVPQVHPTSNSMAPTADIPKTNRLRNTRKSNNPVILPTTSHFVSHVQPSSESIHPTLKSVPTVQPTLNSVAPTIADMVKTKRLRNSKKSKDPVVHPTASQIVPQVQPTLQSVPTVPVPHDQPTSNSMAPSIVDTRKTKRLKNTKKSKDPVFPPTTSQFVPHVQPTSESVHPTLQAVPTVLVPHVQPTSQPVPPSPVTNEAKARRRVGRQSDRTWAVNTIDWQGTTRKFNIKAKDIADIPQGQRIVVEFNNEGGAIGEAQPVLAAYLGSLATNCELFPINFDKFPDMPKFYFDDAFENLIKARFFLNTSETVARRYVRLSIVDKWGQHRHNLWTEFTDPPLTREELIQNVPMGIQRDQWASFVNYRLSPKCKALCERNAENRKKQTIAHTCGSKSFARKREEMIAETGQVPGRGELYLATHKKKDGAYTDGAKEVCKKIEETLGQSNVDESMISPDDAVAKVLGPEHPGRVRCLGLGAAPKHVFNNSRGITGYGGCSSACKDKYNQVMESLESVKETNTLLVNTLKSYMISVEGRIPQQFAGIFASNSQVPDDVSSGQISRNDDEYDGDGRVNVGRSSRFRSR